MLDLAARGRHDGLIDGPVDVVDCINVGHGFFEISPSSPRFAGTVEVLDRHHEFDCRCARPSAMPPSFAGCYWTTARFLDRAMRCNSVSARPDLQGPSIPTFFGELRMVQSDTFYARRIALYCASALSRSDCSQQRITVNARPNRSADPIHARD